MSRRLDEARASSRPQSARSCSSAPRRRAPPPAVAHGLAPLRRSTASRCHGCQGRQPADRRRAAARQTRSAARPVAARRRRAGGRLLPAHRLHAAAACRRCSRAAARVLLERARDPRRSSRTSPRSATARAIPRPHPERGNLAQGLHLFTDHCAGCHQVVAAGRLRDRRACRRRSTTRPDVQIAEAVRIGPYVMPTFSQQAISDRELDSIVRYVDYAQAPGRPRRLGARPPRPGARGARDLVHRGRGARRVLHRDRQEAAGDERG